jgi:hypothetical protein
MPEKDEFTAVPPITTPLARRFQDLVDQGLIQPSLELPAQFAYPSVLVSVPSLAVTGVSGELFTGQGALDGGLGNDSRGDRL